jgi:excisionase family DNA binding protein
VSHRTDVDGRRWGSRRYGACSKDRCSMASERQLAEVRFLTVAEVAAIMRVSKMTVYRLVHSGELPAVRVGRSFRVPEQAVHDYLKVSYVDTA